MNDWIRELERCKVKAIFSEINIYWAEDPTYHQHVEVYGRRAGEAAAHLEEIGDNYCHGFSLWASECPDDHSEPVIEWGWCKTPKHATTIYVGMLNDLTDGERRRIGKITVTKTGQRRHPKYNTAAARYRLRVPARMGFEVFDKPHNVGMVIVRPIVIGASSA